MSVFMFRAAFYCSDCAGDLPQPPALTWDEIDHAEYLWDSDDVAIEFPDAGEADCPQHCDRCHVMLDHRLTNDGIDYVLEALRDGSGDPDVHRQWDELLQDHGVYFCG